MKQSLEEKQSLAMEGLAAGKNCGQLVLLAYQKELNLPEELLLSLSAGLIEGLGTLEGTCGALIGANLVLAMKIREIQWCRWRPPIFFRILLSDAEPAFAKT